MYIIKQQKFDIHTEKGHCDAHVFISIKNKNSQNKFYMIE